MTFSKIKIICLSLGLSVCGGAAKAAIPPTINQRVLVSPVYDEKEGIELAYALWRDGYFGEARGVLENSSEREHPLRFYLLAQLEIAQNAGVRTDEFLKQSLQRLESFKLSDEIRKEVLLFAGQRAVVRGNQEACERHFRQAAGTPSFEPRESLVMSGCARIGSDLQKSLVFSNWLLGLSPEADELEVLQIEVLLRAGLKRSAEVEALKLVSQNQLGTEAVLKLSELWAVDPQLQAQVLEVGALLSEKVEIHEAYAKSIYDAGHVSRARSLFEVLALKESRFRHLSAELCRAEGRLQTGLLHTQSIDASTAWLRQEVAIANEKRSWSQLASYPIASLEDSEVSYAIAYSKARTGNYSGSLEILAQIPNSQKALQLRQKLTDCLSEGWGCGLRIR